jgi:NADH:ubiquinone oxidoreductase subunit F (NADH-binding)
LENTYKTEKALILGDDVMANLETIAVEQMLLEKEADMEAAAKEVVRTGQTWWFVAGMITAFGAMEVLLATTFAVASVLR